MMLLFKRPLRDFILVLLVTAVFGSAEAIALPMLGGASFTTPFFFVLFVILRVFLTGYQNFSLFKEAFGANIWLVLYAIYGVIAAMVMPRMFEGAMSVIAMRAMPYPTLLTFTSQNITQSMYMCLSALTSIAAYAAARMTKADQAFATGWTVATILFLIFAVVDIVGFYAGMGSVMDWARTASYAMVSQSEGGIRRISGSFTEPSSFAGFGAGPLLYFGLLWLLDLKRGLAGILFILVAFALAACTSSTGYGMLAVMFLMVLCGLLFAPMKARARRRKFIGFILVLFAGFAAGFAVLELMPQATKAFLTVVESMTLKKASSGSAIERGTWAAQGIRAFFVSHGLGIGPGSFRSSGIVQAILGSVGVIGAFLIVMHMIQIGKTLLHRYQPQDTIVLVLGVSSILMLTPSMVANSSPDVGIIFSVMSGFAMGRSRTAKLRPRIDQQDAHNGSGSLGTVQGSLRRSLKPLG